MNRIEMISKIISEDYVMNNEIQFYEKIFENTNFMDMDINNFNKVIDTKGIKNLFTIYNYLKDIGHEKLFIEMCEMADTLRNTNINSHSYYFGIYHIDFIKEYDIFKSNINEFNSDLNSKGIHIINDLLKINTYNRLDFRIDLFNFISNRLKNRSFEMDTKILLLTLFGKEYLNKYYNLFDNENNYIFNIDNKSYYNFRNLIKNTGRRFNYKEEGKRNIKFDIDGYNHYLEKEIKPYFEVLFKLYENDKIKSKIFMNKLIYKMNHEKVRNFIHDVYNEKIEIYNLEKEYSEFIPKEVLY